MALAPDGPAGVLPLRSLYVHQPSPIFALGFPVRYLPDSLGRPRWRANFFSLRFQAPLPDRNPFRPNGQNIPI
ncbi:MAG: hypothetical protein MUC97_19105 [Bernardetiaceae bacterium]|nr:hypothetical protein [Bernardetiaceae bacterium]